MKQATFLITTLLIAASLNAGAQAKRSLRQQHTNEQAAPEPMAQSAPAPQTTPGVPRVRLGTIETTESCREKVLRYPRLLPQELGYEVKSFTFTMQAGNTSWGPVNVKGAVYTPEILDKIKETDPVKVKLSMDNIVLSAGGRDINADPVTVGYDH